MKNNELTDNETYMSILFDISFIYIDLYIFVFVIIDTRTHIYTYNVT